MLHEADLGDRQYRDRLAAAINTAAQTGAATLTALCRLCHGAFPTLVQDVAYDVMRRTLPHRAWLDEEPGLFDSALPFMPEPHPVDYEWRYTAATADELCRYLMTNGKRIACFGTPTVFWRLRHLGADAVLFDRNEGLLQSLGPEERRAFKLVDLLQKGHQGRQSFDIALLDPPWYSDHIRAWISEAVRVLRPGGQLILTVFPDLIRPSAFEERRQLEGDLERLGPARRLPFNALYTTPLFEHETLSAFGLADLGQWRCADLVAVSVSHPEAAASSSPPAEATWTKFQFGTQVVAVKSPESRQASGLALQLQAPSADGSFLLRTVSARDPVRRSVTVLTSRNRGLVATQGQDAIEPFLRQLSTGQSADVALRSAMPESATGLRLLLAIIGW